MRKEPFSDDMTHQKLRETIKQFLNRKTSKLSEKKSSSAEPLPLHLRVKRHLRRPQSLTQLITQWQHSPEFLKWVTEWRILPAIPPTYAAWPQNLDVRLIQAIQTQGIDQPYNHQAEAIEAALAGKHVVIVTATASGKTLSYNAPILHTLLNEAKATALYLFPTKALAQDQVATFNDLASGLAGRTKLQAATYDGDTPQATRRKLRDSTPVIITNPDMLHLGILPHHRRWPNFFANLRYIVIDELHTYRGLFGSHFANVLRRLARICAFYGAAPQFICASATIANPVEHATALLDLDEPDNLQVIDKSGAPRAKKHLIFYNPYPDLRRGVLVSANEIARKLLAAQAKTVIFARSRLTVEVLLTYLRDFAAQNGLPAETIRGYRGGYLPLDRREIETGLRQGKVQGVVATTALELGIDIGGLNACVLTGYPGTIASTWQQIGRAGRRSSDSIAVLVASDAPLDQFLMQHPDFFFDRTPEHARIDPNNPIIVLGHLQAATYELPWQTHESFGSYPSSQILLDLLVEEGTLRRTKDGYHWFGQGYPAKDVDLRGTNAHNVVITVKPSKEEMTDPHMQTGITIGTLDVHSAPYLIYPEAIYLHEGTTYQIMALDLQGGRAEARPVKVGYYTQAVVETKIDILETAEESLTLPLYRHRGLVSVTSQVMGYKQVRRYTHEMIGYGPVDLPEQAFDTSAYWLSLPDDLLEAIREAGVWVGSLDYGPAKLWQERREAARSRDGYRCRLCGKPEAHQRQHDVHHIRPLREFLAEAYLNGAELSAVYKAAHALSNLMTLCSPCHRRAELIGQTANAWGGLAHALANLGPLFVMCDPRDLGVSHTSRPAGDSLPTITLYDNTPMGLALADQLYDLHDELLVAAHRLVGDCRCQHGCPACVGPPPSDGVDLRSETLVLLEVVDQHRHYRK